MAHISNYTRPTWLASLVLSLSLSSSAWAQNTPPAPAAPIAEAASPAPAAQPQQPQPDPAAEKTVQTSIRALIAALNSQSNFLGDANFTNEFNQKITADQLRQVLTQLHQVVGDCRLAGQMKTPLSVVGGFLLDCQKGYVPVDIAVEDKAPYRIHSLMIRPNYGKL